MNKNNQAFAFGPFTLKNKIPVVCRYGQAFEDTVMYFNMKSTYNT